ncbi:MAG: UDP-N-acetylmuramoyl-L-alanine--D-glutamate ligase [Planctomycetes bacterium]|nr:UDP-N-acetylmuramoyl-L-alanine--D-glutamate ligase [Planctomycetota bacterium]
MNDSSQFLPPAGATVLVHGLGRFGGGREAVRFLARRGCRVRVADKSAGEDLRQIQQQLQDLQEIDWRLGQEDPALLDGADWFVANPAVPDHHALFAAARQRGLAITQEVDLFLAAYPGTVVAVTGTNGKSTTSTLLHAALLRSGADALLGGNIGHSLLADEARWRHGQIAVLEISSFQLERLHPAAAVHGAVFTRVLKDHLDRHGTLSAYHAAKGRLAVAARDFVVHAADDPVACGYASTARSRLQFADTTPAPHSAGVDHGYLATRLERGPAERLLHRDALRLLGQFQVENALAAALAARALGAAPHPIALALAQAAPLPFRLQLVAVLDGVRIYDNGVSTEVASTRSALQALNGRIHWVGGGKSKDGDYAAVANGVRPYLASAHLFGAAAEPLARALAEAVPEAANSTALQTAAVPTSIHDRAPAALAHALATARPGDAVLWSPAFASFDQYANFRERALEFHSWLATHRAASAAGG